MEDTLVIDTVNKLKVYADPLRQRLLQAFCCNPSTTKQIAGILGEKPARTLPSYRLAGAGRVFGSGRDPSGARHD